MQRNWKQRKGTCTHAHPCLYNSHTCDAVNHNFSCKEGNWWASWMFALVCYFRAIYSTLCLPLGLSLHLTGTMLRSARWHCFTLLTKQRKTLLFKMCFCCRNHKHDLAVAVVYLIIFWGRRCSPIYNFSFQTRHVIVWQRCVSFDINSQLWSRGGRQRMSGKASRMTGDGRNAGDTREGEADDNLEKRARSQLNEIW